MNFRTSGTLLKQVFNWRLLKETYHEWSADKATRLAASLAYYTATSLAPLIIGLLALVTFVYSREQAQTQVIEQVETYVGMQGAEMVKTILANADQPDLARLAGILSLVALIWSASNIFAQLQDALNTIWGVRLRSDLPLLSKVRRRLLPLFTVLGIGVLLLLALVASTVLAAASGFVVDLMPGGALLWQIVNFLISLAIITGLFGVIFKILPDVEIAWRDVWPGAALTGLLFMVGQYALSWYLGRQSGASLYGAAGSLIVLLLWLYYSAQIFLFGAEYTQVYATRYGEGVTPAPNAVDRHDAALLKPAALAASRGGTARHTRSTPAGHVDYRQARHNMLAASAAASPPPTLTGLVGDILRDGMRLWEHEGQLARAELREAMTQLARALALVSGGGLLLYAGALFVLLAVPLLLWATTSMSLWFALLLVGLLLLIEGWLIIVWARQKLAHFSLLPNHTLAHMREDVEVIKDHVTTHSELEARAAGR